MENITENRFQPGDRLPLAVVLDNVRSGLNVGSVFRSADVFAVSKMVLCGITAAPPHREILKTALGSTDTVPWTHEADAVQAVENLQREGFIVLALEQAPGRTWLQEVSVVPGKKYALVLGNEVDGVSAQVLAACDGVVEIPQFGTKHSLNIAVAAGIALWEWAKRIWLINS